MTRLPPRSGVSLIETIAVLAVLLILAAGISYTLQNTERDTKVKAAADIVRGKIAEGRAAAMESARPYRLSISPEERIVRVEPDDQVGADALPLDEGETPFIAEAELPKDVKVAFIPDELSPAVLDSRGWTRALTFLPDGTCREDSVLMEVRQQGVYTLQLRVRGLTGSVSATKGPVQRTPP